METRIEQKLIALGVKANDVVGAAVSGGVDSMVLLHVLCNLRVKMNIIIEAYHMEHGIRGAESERDMLFVQQACKRLNVRCVTARADVPGIAKRDGLSIETAAREVRYAFLNEQRATFIATAHHADDMAETVIMNLCRGSGLKGLSGIPEKRGRLIRPLLHITREEIETYARVHDIAFMQDNTNADTAYTRNHVRHNILPQLRAVNTQAVSHIAAAARRIKEDDDALELVAERVGGIEWDEQGVSVDVGVLRKQPLAIQKRMIRLGLQRCFGLCDVEQKHVDDILALAHKDVNGKRIDVGRGLFAAMVYGKIRIGRNKAKAYNDALSGFFGEGRYVLGDVMLTCTVAESELAFSPGAECLDMAALADTCFRFRREGDFIVPLGMNGKKRLSDYLSDRKVPLHQRDTVVLLAKGSEVLWVVGVGISQNARLKNKGRCYRFQISTVE